jgi:hypothetical protein
MFSPPPGYEDCEADADRFDEALAEMTGLDKTRHFHELNVPGVGLVHARRPMPNAIPALAGAANAKITAQSRLDYLDIFIQNHLKPGEFEDLLVRMITDDDMPPDTMLRVSRAIATNGTARPT